jgi:hypothetical protein
VNSGERLALRLQTAHRSNALAQEPALHQRATGTGRSRQYGSTRISLLTKLVDSVLAPMQELNSVESGMERFCGSDYASFNEVGVPGFACAGTQADYYRKHHKVREDGVMQAAQVLAAWAYNTKLAELLPRDQVRGPAISAGLQANQTINEADRGTGSGRGDRRVLRGNQR